MKFCSDCFNDTEIKAIIDSIKNRDICDITNQASEHIYDTEKYSVLTEYFDDLLSIYKPASELGKNVDLSKTLKLKYDLQNDWNIFSDICKHYDIYNIMKSICPDKYNEYPALFDEDVIIENLYDEQYKKEHSLLYNYEWDDFTNSIRCLNRFHSHHLNLNILKRICFASTNIHRKGEKFFRGRISQKDPLPVAEMGAPPIEKTIDGRVNSAGIRCLYLANNINTTINEVRAGIFDYITVGIFELKYDITVVDFRKINKVSPFVFNSNNLDFTEYVLNKPFLNKINEEMGKSIRKSDSKLDYLPTQYICDYIKSIEEANFAGIEYNSTLYSNGYNLAIFNPDLFKCIETEVYQVQSLEYITKKLL